METPSKSNVKQRIVALVADDQSLRGIMEAGEDDTYWYYLAVMVSKHDGNTYLNERYVQLAKPDTDRDDTFKKNGINRRADDVQDTAGGLVALYKMAPKIDDESDHVAFVK